ncbi:class I SAM-dependent methyltransferase [Shimia thalassica]|uniref:class I SAM-dependent methyltransferase n=1 Tax=Shimia thalassica TaxID=1715693 RepID=UPI0026E33780|nr:class I SAM-dependent methyltransferase [Shimia thalassica]MDO6799748.1 hypothetical protein [Shimia thalassica]
MTTEPVSPAGTELSWPSAENSMPLFSQEVFWRAKFVKPSSYIEHIPLLFWLIADLRPTLCATVGTSEGVAHFAICQAVEKLNLHAACYGFGVWSPEPDDPNKRHGSVPALLSEYNSTQYEEFSRLIPSTVKDAAEYFDDETVDLLVVDKVISSDLLDALERTWVRRMSARGLIVLNGVNKLSRTHELRKRLLKINGDKPLAEFDHGGGVTVLSVGDNPPDRFLQLQSFMSNTARHHVIHQVFRRLGRYFKYEVAAHDKVAHDTEAKEHAKSLSEKIETLKAKIDQQEQSLKLVNAAYDERHKVAASAQADLFRFQTDTTQQLTQLSADLNGRNERLVSLDSEISSLRSENAAVQLENEELKLEIEDLQKKRAESDLALQNKADAVLKAEQESEQQEVLLAQFKAEVETRAEKDRSLQDSIQFRNRKLEDLQRKYDSDIAEANEKRASIEDALETATNEIQNLGSKIEDLETNLSKKDQSLEAAQNSLAKIKLEKEGDQSSLTQAQADLEKQSLELEEKGKLVADLERQITELESQADAQQETQKTRLVKREERIATLSEEVRDLSEARDSLIADSQTRLAEIKALTEIAETSDRQKAELKTKLAQRDTEIGNLIKERDSLTAENAAVLEEVASLTTHGQNTDAQKEKLREKLARREERIANLMTEIDRLQTERDKLSTESQTRFEELASLTALNQKSGVQVAKLRDSLTKVTEESSVLETKITELTQERAALQHEIEQREILVTKQNSQKKALHLKLSRRDERISTLMGDMDDLAKARDTALAESATRLNELVSLTKIAVGKEKSLNAAEAEIATQKAKHTAYLDSLHEERLADRQAFKAREDNFLGKLERRETRISELSVEVDSLCKKLEEASAKNVARVDEIIALTRIAEESQQVLSATVTESVRDQKDLTQLRSKVTRLEKQVPTLKSTNKELTAKVKNVSLELESLTKEHHSLVAKSNRQEKSLNGLEEEKRTLVQTLKEERQKSGDQIETCMAGLVKRERRISEVIVQLETTAEQNEKLSAEVEARYAEIASITQLAEKHHQEAQASSSEIAKQTANIARLRTKSESRRGELLKQNAELDQLRNTVASLQQHIETLSQERDALKDSTSWRMTAPVRQVGYAIRKLKSDDE